MRNQESAAQAAIRYYSVGRMEDFPKRIGRRFIIEETDIAVFRAADDKLFAVENRNPHPRGGTLIEGIVSGYDVYDPLYDVRVSLETGSAYAPDEGTIKTFPVRIVNMEVQIGLQA
jgi:nitrite reductase (NADH) small subunit